MKNLSHTSGLPTIHSGLLMTVTENPSLLMTVGEIPVQSMFTA